MVTLHHKPRKKPIIIQLQLLPGNELEFGNKEKTMKCQQRRCSMDWLVNVLKSTSHAKKKEPVLGFWISFFISNLDSYFFLFTVLQEPCPRFMYSPPTTTR